MIIYFKTFLRLSIYLSWVKNPDRFDVHRDGFQTLTIQQSGIYQFEVIGAGTHRKRPGVRIIGNSQLEKGQKITVALGQKGNTKCGAGGTFVVLDEDENPKPLFIAAGAGYAYDKNFAKGQFTQEASGNEEVGSRGIQQFISDEDHVNCGGAGFDLGPGEELDAFETGDPCESPCSYPQGLFGGVSYKHGTGIDKMGGFGGGGACYTAETWGGERHVYFGAGGGYTGGGTQLTRRGERYPNTTVCVGGGGGSFTIDPEAKFDHVYTEYGKCKIQLIS